MAQVGAGEKREKADQYLDGLFEACNFLVEPFTFAINSVVVRFQIRVFLLQFVESPERVAQTVHCFLQLAVFDFQGRRFRLQGIEALLKQIGRPLQLLILRVGRNQLQFVLLHLAAINLRVGNRK